MSSVSQNLRKDGAIITCEWGIKAIKDEFGNVVGLVNQVRDITKEKMAAEELNLLSTIIKQAPLSVMVTDSHGNMEFANEAFEIMYGYETQEVYGKNPGLIFTESQTREFYFNMWKRVQTGEIWEGQTNFRKKDDSVIFKKSKIFPIRNQKGSIYKYVGIEEDITKTIEMDKYIKEAGATLERQEKLSMIGQITTGIIHEINNPLSYIDINVDTLGSMLTEIKSGDSEAINELNSIVDDLKEGISSIKGIAEGLKRLYIQVIDN